MPRWIKIEGGTPPTQNDIDRFLEAERDL